MKLIASLSVVRVHDEPGPLWPRGVKRLIVVVSDPGSRDDVVVVHGVDPTRRDDDGQLVFEVQIPRARLGSFIKKVVDGVPAASDRGYESTTTADRDIDIASTVVIAKPDPEDLGRKVILALAAAIHSDQKLADAVASRHSQRLSRREP